MFDILIGMILLSLTTLPPAHAQEAGEREARLTLVTGQVTLRSTDSPDQAVPIHDETPLSEGDIVKTGLDSTAEVAMDGETVFDLQAGSEFQIESLSAMNTRLALVRGGLLAKVKPMTPDQGMLIELPTAVAAIRGTEFGVEAAEVQSHVGVFDEGHVSVTGAKGGSPVMLEPNQETQVAASGTPETPHALTHFLPYQARMAQVRTRVNYWHSNWMPMSSAQRQSIRQQRSLGRAAPALHPQHPGPSSHSAHTSGHSTRVKHKRKKRRPLKTQQAN